MLKNIFKVFKDPNSFIIWFLSTVVAFFLWFLYSDIDYVAANYDSRIFAYFDAGLSWIMILVLPLMIAGIFYRSFRFGVNWLTERPTGFIGVFVGSVSAVITGTVCCGVSLDIFPYHGIELKFLGILFLLYGFTDLYRNLELCKIKKTR